jgi:hypothetical protein
MLLLAVSGCGTPAASVQSITQAVGEPQNGYPTPDERLGIMAINRARSDPATVKGPSSTIFPAVAPIVWSYDLSRSSRFHATNLQQSGVTLMHSSPCTLDANVGSNGCTGAPACACASAVPSSCANCANVPAVNNCGTDPFVRIGYFTPIGTGEVVAAGYQDTWATVDGWVTEAAGSDGHRRNLLDQGISSNTMGFGHAGGSSCWSSFDVSDSGEQFGLPIPEIPTAAIQPAQPAVGTSRVWATWADPASGAPRALWAVVDGQCYAMQKELGSPTLNSTWYVDVSLAGGCRAWYVLGHDGRGGRATFPTTGAIQVSVGGGGCASDYTAQAPAAACEGNVQSPDMAMSQVSMGDMATRPGSHDMASAGGGGGSGAVGDACSANPGCKSGLCAIPDGVQIGYCTAACDPADPTACPTGLTCGVIDGANYCVRFYATGSGGGCDLGGVAGDGPSGIWVMALATAAVCLRRRRVVR